MAAAKSPDPPVINATSAEPSCPCIAPSSALVILDRDSAVAEALMQLDDRADRSRAF
jgi:hypothetical protein